MSHTCRLILPPFIALLFLLPSSGAAQDQLEVELDRAKVLYREGRLDQAVSALRAVITKIDQLKDLQVRRTSLAEAYLHLGLAYFALRDEPAAIDNFRRVVMLDPSRTLDPDIYSPRVVEAFARARADVQVDGRGDKPTPAAGDVDAFRASSGALAARPEGAKPQIYPGAKLRLALEPSDDRFEGTLLAVDDRTVTLGVSNQRVGFDRARITRLDVATRQKSHWLAGLIAGTVAGALIGAAEQPGCDQNECYTRAENIGYTATGAGLIGALIGAFIRTDEWAEVPVDNLAVTVSPAHRVAVSFVWRR